MTDIVDQETRSRMMRGIRGKDTRPEMMIRKELHARGFRYRVHVNQLLGKPDIVLPRFRSVILIHGCFWHGHDCPLFRLPATRREFWSTKIARNKERDREVADALRSDGWRCLTVWECAFRGLGRRQLSEVVDMVEACVRGTKEVREIRGLSPSHPYCLKLTRRRSWTLGS